MLLYSSHLDHFEDKWTFLALGFPVRTRLPITGTKHIQGMILNLEIKNFRDHFLYALQTGITKLEKGIAIHTNQVVVLTVIVRAFIFG